MKQSKNESVHLGYRRHILRRGNAEFALLLSVAVMLILALLWSRLSTVTATLNFALGDDSYSAEVRLGGSLYLEVREHDGFAALGHTRAKVETTSDRARE